jgi:eukaryotic-like serine/threonine-protein kinase
MEYSCTPQARAGEVATFYAFDSGSERSLALANSALLLAGRERATVPVLMIDWDTESPALHQLFEQEGAHAGLLEFFEACRDYLWAAGHMPGARAESATAISSDPAFDPGQHGEPDPEALARQVLAAIDWRAYVQRVDQSRPLYLMRAGNFDADYGQRASQMDWEALLASCPALFRCFAQQMARQFRHVLVDARSGRSAAVSICTGILPHKLVALFGPSQRSLDGIDGVVTRAIEYRCSHEDEQRPLLVYPLPCAIDSADSERRALWRRGDARRAVAGYQPALERLLRHSYGRSQVCLDSYLDEVQLQPAPGLCWGGRLAARIEHGGDRFSLTRSVEALLGWFEGGYFPWQSRVEISRLGAIAAMRVRGEGDAGTTLPLARELQLLGEHYRGTGAKAQALACFRESAALRQRALGEDHGDTVRSRSALAELLLQTGQLDEARLAYEMLEGSCLGQQGADHGTVLAARAGLAATLAQQGQFEAALALQEEVTRACEQQYGPAHASTFEHAAAHAAMLAAAGELSRARAAYEGVLDGRRQLLGSEHHDTLDCMHQLALLLARSGELAQARRLQEFVVGARERHGEVDHGATLRAHEALAAILAELGDLDSVGTRQEALARARARSLGADHPDTLSTQLKLASALGQQGDFDAARRLQNHVMRLHGSLPEQGRPATAQATGARQPSAHESDENTALRLVEESLRQASERLRNFANSAGAYDVQSDIADVKLAAWPREDEHGAVLERRIEQVQQLIASASLPEARDLADSLRKPLLRPGVAPALRKRGMAVLKDMYKLQGDKDALMALHEAEARAAGGASFGNVQLANQ